MTLAARMGATARVAALGLVLAGCVVGPRYRTPATPASAAGPFVSAVPASAAGQPLPRHWWRLYQDPVLDNLVERALTQNKDLKVAAANLAYAEGLLEEARAGRYPTTALTTGATYGRSAGQTVLGQTTLGSTAGLTYAAGFTASYQIDLFGRVRRAIESAGANVEATADTEDAVRVTVAGETASAYANICGYGRQISVAGRSLAVVQETYDITARQRDAGALSDFEVEREGALLEQARSAIPPLQGQRRAALFTLAALIGATPAQVPAAASACQIPPILTRPLPVGDGAALLRRRPDVRSAERALASATASIGVAAADLYPTVSLGGSVSSFASRIGGLFDASAVSYGLGPLISWTFPNILVARARVKQTTAQASAALAAFDATVLTALQETEQALATYAAELDHHTALAAAQGHADQALRLVGIQTQAGVASSLDLLQAQATAVAADQAVALSDQAISADQVAVFQALGGGWEDAPPVTAPVIPKR